MNVTATVSVAVAITTTQTEATTSTIPTLSVKGVLSPSVTDLTSILASAIKSSLVTTTSNPLIITPPVFPPVATSDAPPETTSKAHAHMHTPGVHANGTTTAPLNNGRDGPAATPAPLAGTNGTAAAEPPKHTDGGHGGGAGHHGAASMTSKAHHTHKPKATDLPIGNTTVPAKPAPGGQGGGEGGGESNVNVGKGDGNGTATIIVASAGNGTTSAGVAGTTATGGARLVPRGERKLFKFHGEGRKKEEEQGRMLRRRAAVLGEPLVERGLYDHLGKGRRERGPHGYGEHGG